jgi:3-oxoacyl-[acyl-carrier protein] reductase
MDVTGKRVIVTGGVRGLGRQITEKLAARGAAVTVFDRDADGLADLQRELAVDGIQCDVSDHRQVAEATGRFHERSGPADVLVNNAGVIYSAPLIGVGEAGLLRHDVAEWDRVIATDLSSVFYMTAWVTERMVATRTHGVVVNISSISAAGNAGQSAYSAAKAGVNALTATWAKELGPLGIRVVAVAPGFIDSESTRAAMGEAALREMSKRVPLRRLGTPDEVAEAVIQVIENDYLNGKVIPLDGGLVL